MRRVWRVCLRQLCCATRWVVRRRVWRVCLWQLTRADTACVAAMEPANEAVVDGASHSSLMEADDFQLRAVESDESL